MKIIDSEREDVQKFSEEKAHKTMKQRPPSKSFIITLRTTVSLYKYRKIE